VRREGWLGTFLNFDPNIVGVLFYVLIGVFSPSDVYVEPMTEYNPMLWTMSIELAGSALVFLFWYLSPGLRRQRVLLIVLAALLSGLGSYYALFFFGMLMSRFRVDGLLERFRANRSWQILALPLMLATGYANAAHYEAGNIRQVNLLCAAILVFCFYTSRPTLAFFRSSVSRFLGDISFPMYLIHFAVLVSYTSWWIVASGKITTFLAIEIASLSSFVSVVAAIAFRQIEKLALRPIDRSLNTLVAAGTERAVSGAPARVEP
jgi:peptidoglycan/LPS O-acetylase OafA/YrhL